MSMTMDDSIKRWTAKRKAVLVVETKPGQTMVAGASRADDRSPSEIEGWVDDARKGMENALRANPSTSASNTRNSPRICKKLVEKPCRGCAPQESCRPS